MKRWPGPGTVYQRGSDKRWVASISIGPRRLNRLVRRYARTRDDALALLGQMRRIGRDSERFWAKVDTSGDCWAWTGTRNRDGYGLFRLFRRWVRAPRFAYRDRIGPIPPGLGVLHHCDNPPCVCPDHLFVGTQADNMADAMAKGRLGGRQRVSGPCRLTPT